MNNEQLETDPAQTTILVVEDDTIMLQIVQRQLEMLGYAVVTALDGESGWKILQEMDISIVVTDWIMPGIDGLELVRRIRSHSELPYIYSILLTSRSETEDLVQAMDSGADDFLAKPFESEELRVRIRAGERLIHLERDLETRNRELNKIRKHLTEGLQAAGRVQKAFLPSAEVQTDPFQVRWRFHACEHLAGDMLDIVPLGPDRLAIYLLDVSGHGAPAAMLSVTAASYLDRHLRTPQDENGNDLTPGSVARALNQRFPWNETTEQFFTILFGILDLPSGDFRFISAGHPGPIHVRNDAAPEIVEACGLPIGLGDDDYEEHTLHLSPGDRLFLYSDGLSEVRNDSDECFGESRLTRATQTTHTVSLDQALDKILEQIRTWGEGKTQDDLSILGLELPSSDSTV
ncbi:MAG: SpoIIE family protein phosphatase [Planctomycetota bacterium]|jgi:sigma-B regulation protein RsbU (phosphoserine phosphatase)|nr:SpoIIE family protein phosphatase [Planctomycetota bacterium]